MTEMRQVSIRNHNYEPFNYKGQKIETTGSIIVKEEDMNKLSQSIQSKQITILGIKAFSLN